MSFELWLDQNQDRIRSIWDEHLAYLEDSSEHIRYLANSDKCFAEFAEKIYLTETNHDAQT